MYFIIVKNTTKDLSPIMFPKLLDYFKKRRLPYRVVRNRSCIEKLDASQIIGIVLSGSNLRLSKALKISSYAQSIYFITNFPDIPILGICFGAQIISVMYGGKVESLPKTIKGHCKVDIIKRGVLFESMSRTLDFYEHHTDHITVPPLQFNITALDKFGNIEAIESRQHHRFGVQFHPENSSDGQPVLDNFVRYTLQHAHNQVDNTYRKKKRIASWLTSLSRVSVKSQDDVSSTFTHRVGGPCRQLRK